MAKMWVVLLLSAQWNPGEVEVMAVCPNREVAVAYVEKYVRSYYDKDDDPELEPWDYDWCGDTYSYVGNDEVYTLREVEVING